MSRWRSHHARPHWAWNSSARAGACLPNTLSEWYRQISASGWFLRTNPRWSAALSEAGWQCTASRKRCELTLPSTIHSGTRWHFSTNSPEVLPNSMLPTPPRPRRPITRLS